ncbi:hypothetical protein GCM10010112_87110 [Actinoplanes lobatus]|uniref:Uncharacterized protein n=1 Tax=Actinoplanes lobatus TaxID=113568 RepID=A0ABQ4AW16_9ACTN|nr:hypothetical protein GCM10010112_87110 [Actinoplanes lobatus]GIE45175.1 hypothetical protein Alo02nite_80730 [Actinoplanes lobatus]
MRYPLPSQRLRRRRGGTGCQQQTSAKRSAGVHVLKLEIISTDGPTKVREIASIYLGAHDEALNGGAEERAGATRRLYQTHRTEIMICSEPGKIK